MADNADKTEDGGGRWELAAHLVRDRRLGFTMLGGGLAYFAFTAFSINPMPCPFLQVTGAPCPGCGMTRSCLAFLQGDFPEVLHQNPFGPVFAFFWAVVGFGITLPQPWRGRFANSLGRFEKRSRWAVWVTCGLAIYSLTRWLGFC